MEVDFGFEATSGKPVSSYMYIFFSHFFFLMFLLLIKATFVDSDLGVGTVTGFMME